MHMGYIRLHDNESNKYVIKGTIRGSLGIIAFFCKFKTFLRHKLFVLLAGID